MFLYFDGDGTLCDNDAGTLYDDDGTLYADDNGTLYDDDDGTLYADDKYDGARWVEGGQFKEERGPEQIIDGARMFTIHCSLIIIKS